MRAFTKTGIKHSVSTLITKFNQEEKETVRDYANKLRLYTSRCPEEDLPSQAKIISIFLEGLKSIHCMQIYMPRNIRHWMNAYMMQLILMAIVTYMARTNSFWEWIHWVQPPKTLKKPLRIRLMRLKQWWKWSWREWIKSLSHQTPYLLDVRFLQEITLLCIVFQNKITRHTSQHWRQISDVILNNNGQIMRLKSVLIG